MNFLTPISHLFNDETKAKCIIDSSDFLEARERTANLRFPKTTHYHIDFDLNLQLSDKQLNFLKEHVKEREEITNITFQASKDCYEVELKDGIYYPSSDIVPLKKQIENTKLSIKKIKDILGSDRNIGIENNNYFPSGAYNISTSLDYLLAILEFNDLHLLFDMAHGLVTCFNSDIIFKDYSEELLSTKKCKQIHLCQPTYFYEEGRFSAKDSHEIPSYELTQLSIDLAHKWDIENITVEYYKDSDKLVTYLKYLRKMVQINEKK